MRKAIKVDTCYRFNRDSSSWDKMDVLDIETGDKVPENQYLSMVCFNILFSSPFSDTILRSLSMDKQRFEYLADTLIPSFKSDIICLQEIIPDALEHILNNDYIRSNYFISAVPGDLRVYDSMIISRYPFMVAGFRRLRIGIFETRIGSPLICNSFHLVARETQHQMQKRFAELRLIGKIFNNPDCLEGVSSVENKAKRMINAAVQKGNIICSGDMNFHNIGETDILYELGYEDVWLSLRNLEEGYTWDPKMNQFIGLLLPCDNRRMRLDRIFFSKSSKNLIFRDIQIICNKPIPGLSKFCYKVFPSDHFGLKAHFQLTTDTNQVQHRPSFDYTQNRTAIVRDIDPWTTGYRSVKKIIAYRVMMVILMCMILIGSLVAVVVMLVKVLK